MSSNTKYLVEQFEREVWLYLDKDLPAERMQYWNDKIYEHKELKTLLDETTNLINLYNEAPLKNINDYKFSEIVKTAVKKKNPVFEFFDSINPFSKENESWLSPFKLAFGGVMIASAIVILIVSNKQNPVTNISNELLDWNSDNISQQISRVGTSISLIKDDNFKEFIKQKRTKEKLDRDIFIISDEIDKLKNEIKEHSL